MMLKDVLNRTYYICPKCGKNRRELIIINEVNKCKRCHKLIAGGKKHNKNKLNRYYNQLTPHLSKPIGIDTRYYTFLIIEIARLLNKGTKL